MIQEAHDRIDKPTGDEEETFGRSCGLVRRPAHNERGRDWSNLGPSARAKCLIQANVFLDQVLSAKIRDAALFDLCSADDWRTVRDYFNDFDVREDSKSPPRIPVRLRVHSKAFDKCLNTIVWKLFK